MTASRCDRRRRGAVPRKTLLSAASASPNRLRKRLHHLVGHVWIKGSESAANGGGRHPTTVREDPYSVSSPGSPVKVFYSRESLPQSVFSEKVHRCRTDCARQPRGGGRCACREETLWRIVPCCPSPCLDSIILIFQHLRGRCLGDAGTFNMSGDRAGEDSAPRHKRARGSASDLRRALRGGGIPHSLPEPPKCCKNALFPGIR